MASESPRRWLTRAAREKGGAGGGPADPDGPQQAARDWLASRATQGAACHAHCSCTASSPARTKTGGRAARKAVQKGLLGRPGPRFFVVIIYWNWGGGGGSITKCRQFSNCTKHQFSKMIWVTVTKMRTQNIFHCHFHKKFR